MAGNQQNEQKKKLQLKKKEIDKIFEKRKIKTEDKERSPSKLQAPPNLKLTTESPPTQGQSIIKSIKS